MSLYQLKNDIPNLIGSLESGNPGLLTVAIRENPYGVLLLDEIEKSDKDLINIFLTVLDEGYFTDGSGKRVDCKNLVVIATSNAASNEIYKKMGVAEEGLPIPLRPSDFEGQAAQAGLPAEALAKAGGNPKQAPSEFLISYLIEQKIFSPEFLNRFDGIIIYQPLTIQSITKIAKKYLSQTSEDIYKLHRVKINVSDQLLSQIVQKGYDPKFGARNLQRVIKDEIEDKIAKLILGGKTKEGETINL